MNLFASWLCARNPLKVFSVPSSFFESGTAFVPTDADVRHVAMALSESEVL